MQTILYINGSTDSGPYRMKLAGLKRYSRMKKWSGKVVYCARGEFSVHELLAEYSPIGVVVEGCFKPNIIPAEEFEGLPVVYLDIDPNFDVGDCDIVIHRAADTARCAFEGLASAGVDSFAYAGWFANESWTLRREALFAAAAREKGFEPFLFRSSHSEAERDAYMRDLSDWLKKLPRNTGVLAANDAVASCVLTCCRDLGIDVPGEIALVGVDNERIRCEGETPQLASVQLDFEQAGFLAGMTLDARIAQPQAPRRVVEFGPLGLIRRASLRSSPVIGKKMASSMELIRNRACEGLSAAEVVAYIGGSRRSAEMRFRETVGKSILEEIMDIRFARLYHLLEHTDITLDALATFCGFNSLETLRKLFRRRTGLSLREWRNSRRMRANSPGERLPSPVFR